MSDVTLNAESVESTQNSEQKEGERLGNSDSSIVSLLRDAANDNNKVVDDIVEVGGGGNGIENENDAAVTTELSLGSNGREVGKDFGNYQGQARQENLSFEIGQEISGGEVQGNIRRRRGPRSKSSQNRGVTFYRRTERWESHSWDEGKLVHLGEFDTAHAAPARAYDRTSIKFKGVEADINFSLSDSETDLVQINVQMKNLTKEEYTFRRPRTRFSRESPFGNSHRESEEHIHPNSGSCDVDSRDSRGQTEDNEIQSCLASPPPHSPETDHFGCMDVEHGNGICRTCCRTQNLKMKALERMFAIANFIVELLSIVFEQLSSQHYSLFLPICVGMSFLALFICTFELAYKAQKERATWRWCGTIPWFYYPSQSGIRLGSVMDIAALVCAFGQCILTIVGYCLFLRNGNSPIKISIWASVFASCQLCSKFCGEFKHEVHGQDTLPVLNAPSLCH
ncbi:uncharacterized protein LOC110673353 isoform X2 [Hevea brasiliensis]|uniref:uncharacterized protein LOC110673353 isoform X2 n=1 Tax=Hevea brasiliensis TaxID=3981 RepID=UPI0025E4DA98|nr:uncharacterized protein LOC110673353 isoform X2 [Hevea brasiliensis]